MNKRLKQLCWIFISLAFCNSFIYSQNIFSQLENRNNPQKNSVTIHQDKRIESLVYGVKKTSEASRVVHDDVVLTEESESKEIPGYRVQIYSSNVQKTAKMEAFRIEAELQQILPDLPVYVFYHSPFWKVRAGNCRTMDKAQALRAQIGEAYPQVKRDLYVVRDRIKVPE